MKKKVLSMILAFAMIIVQIPASVYVLAADRDSGIDSAVVGSASGSSTGWTIDDVLDLIDALPQADEVADESKVEVKIALNEALAAYSAAMEQADIDAEELRDAVGDERREKLKALSELLRDVVIPDLDSGIDAQTQADFKMGRLSLMGQILLKGSSPTVAVIGSAENPFLIGTPEVLAELGELTQNNEEYGTGLPFAVANYKLVADIDLAGYDGIQRITNFKGTFDGDGHVVKNMKTAGLFATAETGSVIKNLGIENCMISCQGGAGGVAAYTDGSIMNCYVTGTITGIDPVNSIFIGGVVGEAGANAVITNCYAAVNVSGVDHIGGVVGKTTGTVTNCYATGNVSGSSAVGGVVGLAQDATIANCYATGNISASATVGGVVGWCLTSTITNCAALGQTVTGNLNSGRVVGANSGTISGCYAFSSMKIGASGSQATVTGGAANNAKGADLSYAASNAEGVKLSAQFGAIFNNDAAWVYTTDGLPTLNGVNGDQSSELPAWFTPTSFNISTAAQLDELRQLVNNGTVSASGYTNTTGAVYNLMNDIDLAGFDSDTDAANGNWTPIGNSDKPFNGIFEGNDHAIKNMTITLSSSNVGLFGYIAVGAAIRNVGVENCTVTGSSSTGGVVGAAFGTVTNCYSTGNVTGTSAETGGVVGTAYGTITNCYTTGSIFGVQYVGGVAGHAYVAITNCYATGDVSGGNFSGGVVGVAGDAVTNCYAAGSVSGSSSVGGVVGRSMKKITNCMALGQSVTGSYATGGVVGYASGAITSCATLGQTVTCSGNNYGRVAGVNNSTISGCYAWSNMKIGAKGSEAVVTDGAADNKNGADYTGSNAQFSNIFNNDTAWNYTPGALPTLAGVGGSQSSALPIWIGASGSVFAISTAAQLDELRQLVNNGTASASGYTNTAESYYYLTADIDLSGSGSVTPIGLGDAVPFRGTFDGKGYAIQNMTITSSGNVGLFGYTAGHSVIKNLGVDNCDVTGGDNTGGVVGFATGMVTNCYSTGSVTGNNNVGGVVGSAETGYEMGDDFKPVYYTGTVTGCHSACTVSSGEASGSTAGGVVGYTKNALTNCYATGNVSVAKGDNANNVGGVVGYAYGAVSNCYSTGSVSGGNDAGGVVGSAHGAVTNCYATGNVSDSFWSCGGVVGRASGAVTNCYATGSVFGKNSTGGVVGYASGSVTNCAVLEKTVTATYNTGRIVGVTTSSGTVSNCFGWSGMSIGGDNRGNNGTDLTYIATNAAGARLSAQFGAIFGSDAAWNYTADALPVLAGAGGSQSSELPYWVMLGAGTEANPYIISTAAQLNDLRKVVNDGATSAYGYTNAADRFYKLSANIGLSGFDDDGNSANGNWTPIGTSEKMFLGHFDGNGYAVKQMTIQLPSTNNATGLFGVTAEGSVIKNLGVENCIVSGRYYTGGVVGFAYDAVTGCYVTGTIGGNNDTGGVVGLSSVAGSVTRCYATCSVNGNERVGGVVGYTVNSVTGCYASGSVTGNANVGGVVGEASNSVTSCVALGKTVTGNSATTGRIAGGAWHITDCYAWRYMKIGEGSSRAVVTDGTANNKNGADLLYLTERGLSLNDALFTWPGFAENGWDVPENQTSGGYKVMPKLPYQSSYPTIPAKLVQVLRLTLNYNNGTDGNTPIYAEYGNVTLPDKSDLAAMKAAGKGIFAGWDPLQDIGFFSPRYQAGDQLLLAQDTTLYAQWKWVSATINGTDPKTGFYEVASYYDTLLKNQTTLTLENNTFKAAENLNINSWFTTVPSWLTVTLTAEAGSDTATITFSGTPNISSSILWSDLIVPTSALTVPMDAENLNAYKVHVSIYKAKPTVTWAAAEQSVTYTAAQPDINPPTVTLSGTDVYSGSFEYSYKTDAAGTVYTNGLPTAVGTYYVKAHIDADDHGDYSPAESDTDLTLTISYLQTDAVAIAEGTQSANGWFTSDVTLKAPEGYTIATSNGSDASWASSLTTINSDTCADYTYYLQKGSSGEITDAKTIAVNRDTVVPVIGTVTYSAHQSFLDWIFHKSVIQVTVPVTDTLSGADHISYVLQPLDGGTQPAAQTAVVDSDGNAIFDIDKTFKGIVAVAAYDKAGNASVPTESKRMAVEETAPTLSLQDAIGNAYTNNWYTGTQWLYIFADDTGSGIQSLTYAVDGGDTTTLFEAKETDTDITPNLVKPVPVREGAHTYTITVTDNALNTTTQTLTIKKDAIYPTVDSVTPSNITDTTLTLTAAASDATSGVKQYYLYYEEGEVPYADFDKDTCITSTNGTFQLTSLTRNTTYTISIWAEDTAGNISQIYPCRFQTHKTSIEGATVALGSSSFTYTGQSQTPSTITVTLGGETLTAGTDYTVSYSNSNGGENNTTNVGTVTVTVTAVESSNYSGMATGTTYTIAPAAPTMTWSKTDKAQTVTYTGSPAIITAPQVTLVNSETYIGNIQYAYKKVDGLMNGLFAGYTDGLPTEAGKYLVKAQIAANGNYAAADSTSELELTIEKAAATLSIKSTYTGKTYDGMPMADPTAAQIESNITNPAVTYAYYADNSGAKGSKLNAAPVNAGIYWVEGSIAEADNTKAVTSAAVKFTITRAPLTINGGTVAARKWDGQATVPVERITFSGLQNSQTLLFGTDYTVTGAVYAEAAVGTGKIVTSGTVTLATTGTAVNYTLPDTALSAKGLTGTIIKADGPAAPTFSTWDDSANTFTFNSTVGTIYEYRINSTDANDWTAITASGDTTAFNVGNAAISAGGLEVRVKTTDTHEAGAILTNTSEQVFTASIEGSVSIDKTTGVTYGETLTATASGYQTGAALHYQWTVNGSNVGMDSKTYTVQSADIGKTITVTVTATGYNSSLTPITSTNEVLKRSITVTADAKTKTYGQADPAWTHSITSGSLINGDTLSGVLSRTAGEAPNTYAITQGTLDNVAYAITYESANLTINKADVTLNVTVNPAAAKAGKTVTVTVSAVNASSNLAASGWNHPAGVTLTDPNNSSMTLTPANGKSCEYTASYQIPAETAENTQLTFIAAVADTTGNYTNPQSKNAVLTVTEKSAVKLALTADKTNGVTYGDSVVYTAKVEKNNPVLDALDTLDGTVTFYLDGVKAENLLATKTIGDTLNVTLDSTKLTAGEHTVYAVYSGNAEFAAATQNATTNVAAKSLSWDASGLTALKKYDGDSTANVSGTLLVIGALEGTDSGFSYTSLSGTYASAAAGHQTVTVTVNGAILTNSNYALPAGNPTFTGKINAVSEITNVPESGKETDYKLEQEHGISHVPNALISNPDLNTPAKIETRMKVSVESAMNGVGTANIEIYDITLLFSTDNDQTWQTATASNFPENGVTIILPYPSGTNAADFNFVITHMFTTGANAGTTETIIPTRTAEGLKFTLHSLSPVAVGYKAATSNSGSGGSGDSTDYNAEFWQSVENKINATKSGDVIKVDAKFFDKMPYTVMDSLRKNSITLVVDWSNGNTITIPAGKAQKSESGRIYWPLSKLEELYADVTFVETPDTSGAQVNPETGGVGYIAYASTGETVPITGLVQKVEATAAEDAVKAQIPMTATPPTEGVTAIPANTVNSHIWATVVLMLLAAIGGCWIYRRKVTDK